MAQDWFAQNSPKKNASSDWFSDNAPTQYQQDVANAPGVPKAPVPAGLQAPTPTAPQTPSSSTIGNLGIGAAKGLLKTATFLPSAAGAKVNDMLGYSQPESVTGRKRLYEAQGKAQAAGLGLEQAGEFLAPGAGEEKAAAWFTGKAAPLVARYAPSLAKLIPGAAKIGAQSLTSGAINSAQGGSFGQGAAAGGIAGGVGQGIKAIAPFVAESALGVRGVDRAYGRNTGKAILDETSGIRPGTVADQAKEKIADLSNKVEGLYSTAPDVSLAPARAQANAGLSLATSRNNPDTIKQTEEVVNQLTKEYGSGGKPVQVPKFKTVNQPTGVLNQHGVPVTSSVQVPNGTADKLIPNSVPARQAHRLRQGISDLKGSWNPATKSTLADDTAGRVYHELDQSLDAAAPGSSGLNQRMSSLIPVAQRAGATDLNAGALQKVLGKFGRPTGALVGATGGFLEGKREGGIGRGLAYGAIGLGAPELIASPTTQMLLARSLYGAPGAAAIRGITGSGLQFTKK